VRLLNIDLVVVGPGAGGSGQQRSSDNIRDADDVTTCCVCFFCGFSGFFAAAALSLWTAEMTGGWWQFEV
jgi:hypothetical protein